LASFLFLRIKKDGFDRRFNKMKYNALQFLMTWTLQGLWVIVTLSAGLAAMTSSEDIALGLMAYIGAVIWVVGFSIEVVADRQKSLFREHNKSGFIKTGLWSWSRHPNYFGEILLWLGIAVIAYPTLEGWRLLTLISPIFVFVLLVFVSGVKMLERSAFKRWGQDEAYLDYLSKTSVLIPLPPSRS
jgi:steroid 5-alpha reductase family enzyme